MYYAFQLDVKTIWTHSSTENKIEPTSNLCENKYYLLVALCFLSFFFFLFPMQQNSANHFYSTKKQQVHFGLTMWFQTCNTRKWKSRHISPSFFLFSFCPVYRKMSCEINIMLLVLVVGLEVWGCVFYLFIYILSHSSSFTYKYLHFLICRFGINICQYANMSIHFLTQMDQTHPRIMKVGVSTSFF